MSKNIYLCEICNREFNNIQECVEHEATCEDKIEFKCMMCGETTFYAANEYDIANQCHTFTKKGEYGSQFDGEKIEIKLCDTCIGLLINK